MFQSNQPELPMFNCNNDVCAFHDEKVTLNNSQQSEMRNHRDANRERLKKGLKNNNKPVVNSHQAQGSYAMHTMVQDENNDYDIDDGVVFLKEDLVGSQGSNKTAQDARKMVSSALDDGSFSEPPAVLKNCVRIMYQQGYHVDVPVYRQLEDDSLELASSDWKGSSPSEVTAWYEKSVCDQSPDESNGRQLRRITKHIKAYKNSRLSWKPKMASGFAISILVVECYVADGRDDISLYKTMKAIHNRLTFDLEVSHPVRHEKLTKGPDDAKTTFLREKLSGALNNLSPLLDGDCSRLTALKAWEDVFNHQFWTDLVTSEAEKTKSNNSAVAIPTVAATKPWLNHEIY